MTSPCKSPSLILRKQSKCRQRVLCESAPTAEQLTNPSAQGASKQDSFSDPALCHAGRREAIKPEALVRKEKPVWGGGSTMHLYQAERRNDRHLTSHPITGHSCKCLLKGKLGFKEVCLMIASKSCTTPKENEVPPRQWRAVGGGIS